MIIQGSTSTRGLFTLTGAEHRQAEYFSIFFIDMELHFLLEVLNIETFKHAFLCQAFSGIINGIDEVFI